MVETPHFDRVIWIVLDSVGIGELPDAADYGDVGRDTLGHIARSRPLKLPNLVRHRTCEHQAARASHAARAPRREFSAKALPFLQGRTRRPATGKWPASGSTRRFRFTARISRRADRRIRAAHRPAHAGQQARVRHRNHQGARRRARAHGFSDCLHVGRQRVSDRRARGRDSDRRAVPRCARSRGRCSTGRTAWGA